MTSSRKSVLNIQNALEQFLSITEVAEEFLDVVHDFRDIFLTCWMEWNSGEYADNLKWRISNNSRAPLTVAAHIGSNPIHVDHYRKDQILVSNGCTIFVN